MHEFVLYVNSVPQSKVNEYILPYWKCYTSICPARVQADGN